MYEIFRVVGNLFGGGGVGIVFGGGRNFRCPTACALFMLQGVLMVKSPKWLCSDVYFTQNFYEKVAVEFL